MILEGKIELGFTKEMVLLAAGSPDRKTKKTTKDGVGEEWTYFKYGPGWFSHGSRYYGSPYWYDPYLTIGGYGYPVSFYRRGRKIKDMVVNFENGEVIAFEEDV